MFRLSYWILPIISGTVWLATLMGMLVYWCTDAGRPLYPSMQEGQTIAYISDVGAYRLKPLFVTGCVITTIFFDLSFAADRWLRHKGRLVPNTTRGEKILSALTIGWALVGTVGLICLSIFDTYRYPRLHNIFLLFFVAGYVFSAIFICWEYQRLGIRNRDHSVLRNSFWIKLAFVLITIALAIAFGVLTFLPGRRNQGAIVEWAIAFFFSLYVFSFYIDLYPAVRTKGVGNGYGASGFRGATVAGRGWGRGGKRTAGFGFEKRGMPAEPPMAHLGDVEQGRGLQSERYRG